MAYFYQIIVNGLHNGALYALLAYGYVLLHQVVPRANLAHGAVFAFSGQVLTLAATFAYSVLILTFAGSLGVGLIVTLLLSGLLVSVLALIIMPRFAASSPNMMIVCTLALAIVLMEAVRIGSDGRDLWLPPLSTLRVDLGQGAAITLVQAINLALIAAMLAGLDMVLAFTGFGRAIRAVSQDVKAASLLGINSTRTIAQTTALASGLAAIGGVLALIHFGNMSFGAGLTYGLKVLFIAAAGGFSTPRTAAIAAFAFGEAESLWDGYLPIMWREVFFLAVLSLMLVLRGRVTA